MKIIKRETELPFYIVFYSLWQAIELAGGSIGGPIAWLVSDGLGRQTALTTGGIPALCGWLMISYAPLITGSRAAFLTVLFTGRFLTGVGVGWAIFCVSVSIYG